MEKNTPQNVYPDVPPPYTALPQPHESTSRPDGYPHAPSYSDAPSYPNAPQMPQNAKYQPNFEVPLVMPQVQLQARVIPIGPDPILLGCPVCHAEIRTEIKHEPSTKTHLMALLVLLLCWPCACLPYCIDSCQNANHYCPNCHAYIGSYKN